MKYVFGLLVILAVVACVVVFLLPTSGVSDTTQNVYAPKEGELENLKSILASDSAPRNSQNEPAVSCSTSSTSSVCVSKRSIETSVRDEVLAVPVAESTNTKVPSLKKYIELVNPSGFINTNDKTITIKEYIGKKVILLNVMTYSCSNCQATFPYVNSWYEKYTDDGLIVIGLHTPEFAFEKDIKNVEEAMKKYGITYPVVMDNEYATWNAYGNRYWPRKYLIDIHGNITYDHIGEGAYEETEAEILRALIERKEVLGM